MGDARATRERRVGNLRTGGEGGQGAARGKGQPPLSVLALTCVWALAMRIAESSPTWARSWGSNCEEAGVDPATYGLATRVFGGSERPGRREVESQSASAPPAPRCPEARGRVK